MTKSETTFHNAPQRHDRLLQEREHDPYKSKSKLSDPTVCPECGVVYHKGRWQWGETPADANSELCPACHRVQDRVPSGFLHLSGDFFAEHQAEIMSTVRNVESKEKAEHPLKRIMAVESVDQGVTITFTDPHLARGCGEAVQSAYKGELDFAYQDGDRLLRVSWKR
jgi:NMD protein affecting ribosome stability and mRNA decay